MRTLTIYSATKQAEREMRVGLASYAVHVHDPELVKRTRQWAKFERGLLRRLDERDALAERNAFLLASAEAAQANLAACRRELAEARAFISTIIDAPGVA